VETYQSDVGGLITDLDSIPTVPNLVGTYVGTAKATSGNHVGRIMGLTVQFTSEGDDGSLTATVTLTGNDQPEVQTLVGTVGSDGSFNAAVGDPSGEGATLAGHVIGTKITGTYVGSGDSGVFSVSRSA
jgi:hypothetical protein